MYTAPTRAEIDAQIIASIEGQIGQTVTIFPKAFVRVLSKALSAVLSLAYQFIAWAIRQIFPATSDAESLSYYGDWYAMPRAAATSAILQITISGDDPTAIPAGTLWAYGSLVFTQAADVVISSGTASAQIQALTYGIAGNLPPSTALSLPSPKAGVTGAVVAAVSTAAVDEESLDLWRSRIVQRMQNQPQGGATGDYIRWAMEVAGIAGAHVKKIGTDVLPLSARRAHRLRPHPRRAQTGRGANIPSRPRPSPALCHGIRLRPCFPHRIAVYFRPVSRRRKHESEHHRRRFRVSLRRIPETVTATRPHRQTLCHSPPFGASSSRMEPSQPA